MKKSKFTGRTGEEIIFKVSDAIHQCHSGHLHIYPGGYLMIGRGVGPIGIAALNLLLPYTACFSEPACCLA
uniref:hypothetical protein n=1 Tax=Clostridium sp. NkU-1 TaxID=1095009 RepID=UPI000AAEA881